MVEELTKNFSHDKDTIIAYYFFDFNRKESLSTLTFLQSILHQLIRVESIEPTIWHSVASTFLTSNGKREPDINELEDLVLMLCEKSKKVSFFFDGIDELNREDHRYILRFLKNIYQAEKTVKLFIASQLEIDIIRSLGDRPVVHINIKAQDLDLDIRNFIATQLEKEIESGSLSFCTRDLIDKMEQDLARKAKGM